MPLSHSTDTKPLSHAPLQPPPREPQYQDFTHVATKQGHTYIATQTGHTYIATSPEVQNRENYLLRERSTLLLCLLFCLARVHQGPSGSTMRGVLLLIDCIA